MPAFIPDRSLVERGLPVEDMFELALREGSSKKPIYKMHKWWARRLGSVFRMLLLASTLPSATRTGTLWKLFYQKNDLSDLTVLDPFMGGGTTIVESTKCRANTIGIDIDPVAGFITKNEVGSCDISSMERTLEKLNTEIGERITKFYKTLSSDGAKCDVIYYFWVYVINCPNCREEFEAHPNYKLGWDRKIDKTYAFCSKCKTIHKLNGNPSRFKCKQCSVATNISKGLNQRGRIRCPTCDTVIITRDSIKNKPRNWKLFAVEYLNSEGERVYKLADDYDVELFEKAERQFRQLSNQLRYPRDLIPKEGRSDQRPLSYGFNYYWELFNSRQLLSLSLILDFITRIPERELRQYFLLAFSDSLASNNMLCLYDAQNRKVTPLFGLHAYNVVTRPIENNVFGLKYGRGSYIKCLHKVIQGKKNSARSYERKYANDRAIQVVTGEDAISHIVDNYSELGSCNPSSLLLTQSSENLSNLPDNSIELILTDPPYFDNLSYSELSDFYYVWIRESLNGKSKSKMSTPYKEALFVASNGEEEAKRFSQGLARVFSECGRVLKGSGLMIFTFHHRKTSAWASIYKCLMSTNLIVSSVYPIRSEGSNGFHNSEGSLKWDAVITCRPGTRPKRDLKIGYLWRHVDTNLRKWESRLVSPHYEFGWADRISLGFAFAISRMNQYQVDRLESIKLLNGLRTLLLNRVPRDRLHLTRRDHRSEVVASILQ